MPPRPPPPVLAKVTGAPNAAEDESAGHGVPSDADDVLCPRHAPSKSSMSAR
jgi:hypothetical protein